MRKDCIRLNAHTDANECNLIHFDYTSSFFFPRNYEQDVWNQPLQPLGSCPRPIARKQHLSCQGSAEKVLLPVENFLNCCTRIKDSAGSWSCTSAAGTVETEISEQGVGFFWTPWNSLVRQSINLPLIAWFWLIEWVCMLQFTLKPTAGK